MLLLCICFYQWDFFPSLIFIFLVVVFSLWSSLFNIFCKAGWKWKKVKEKKVKVAQSCPSLCDPMDYTVHGILQARILEWVAFPFSRGSSQPRDQNQVSCIAGGFFTSWATREAQWYWIPLTFAYLKILSPQIWILTLLGRVFLGRVFLFFFTLLSLWIYHGTLFWLAKFLPKRKLIVTWKLPCMWLVAFLLMFLRVSL